MGKKTNPIIFICKRHWKIRRIKEWIDARDVIPHMASKGLGLDDFSLTEIECPECSLGEK
ncbi:MAG: hypothetical protein AAB696_01805 [Patescibacteria group bacterium]